MALRNFNILRKGLQKNCLRHFSQQSKLWIQVGEPLPSVKVHENSPAQEVNVLEFFKPFKRSILVGVPGAFTPGCSKSHLPSYLKHIEALRSKGIESIAFISVNDAFVMKAWGDSNQCDNKITMLADVNADFVKKAELDFDVKVLGGIRSKRFAMVLKNGVVEKLFVEPDNTGLSITLADQVLNEL